jgi:crotonobetainyl-CoA:carnitine CoA-transferase CaiB-like acyl-CoA transferase
VPDLPLSGVRILDFTQVYAGPTCTRLLSDLGADVIKIEGVKRMDITRNFVMPDNLGEDDYWNKSGYFLLRNGGKRSLTLDFSEESGGTGLDVVKKLVPHCDIVAESFTPHVMAKFGLDYESLKAIKDDIIMISLSGYGQNGPWRDWTAYGMGLEPASGISSITGYPNSDPQRTGISFTDPYSGIVGAGAVLSALVYRRRTGTGQYIDLSEQEAAIPVVGHALMDQAVNTRGPRRIGNRSHWYAPQGCYRCSGEDNWLTISIKSDEQWRAFCDAVGHPEWASDDRFTTVQSRRENHDTIDRLISSWTESQDQMDAMHKLQATGVTAAAVLNPKQVLLNRHLRERGFFERVDTEKGGVRPVPHQVGARFSAFEPDSARRAPHLGEHNHEILRDILGLSDAEIDGLEEKGVIGDTPQSAVPLPVMRMFVQFPLASYQQMGALGGVDADYREQLGLPPVAPDTSATSAVG